MKYIIKNKYWKLDKDYNIDKLLYLLVDRPDYTNIYGSAIMWLNKEEWHRNYDLPTIIYNDGEIIWYKNGKRHREKAKPIKISIYGHKEYYINGNILLKDNINR